MRDLSSISTYYLLLELMNGGEAGLLPELEPFSEDELFAELEERAQQKFGNSKDTCSSWFLGSKEHGSEMERANFLIFLETREAMSRVIGRFKKTEEDK